MYAFLTGQLNWTIHDISNHKHWFLSTCFAALMCQTFGTVETIDDKPYLQLNLSQQNGYDCYLR